MKLDKLVGERFKEKPSDCVVESHALMMRGGYMKDVAKGIYSQFTPLKRICQKIEAIIREEMDAIDGQEVLFPVALPASLWDESGRYESVGSELLRFTDRNGSKMVLGMTHEEAAVQLVRDYAKSYNSYPFMIYQIQTKFRDEARPRAGLIRVREFTMKDAYSFHTSQEDLERYYQICYDAYNRIFARAGIPEVVTVASDSGMMGGSLSHEYMLLTPIGEDSIAICSDCDYRANMEAAESVIENAKDAADEPLTKVHTPNIHTIEEICDFLHSPLEKSCKAVVYQKNMTDDFVVIFIRGDLDVNETKLTNYKAMAYLINKVEALEKKLLEKNEVPTTPADKWFNIDELKDYLPDHPAKQTIYGWVSKREIPFHKGGKKLRFLQSDIDKWLSCGKRKGESELRDEANNYCETKRIGG